MVNFDATDTGFPRGRKGLSELIKELVENNNGVYNWNKFIFNDKISLDNKIRAWTRFKMINMFLPLYYDTYSLIYSIGGYSDADEEKSMNLERYIKVHRFFELANELLLKIHEFANTQLTENTILIKKKPGNPIGLGLLMTYN